MSFLQPTWVGWRFRRLPPMILAVFLVIPALISCNAGRTPAESPVPEATTIVIPQDTSEPTPPVSDDDILAECIRGDVSVHFHVQLTITLEGRALPIPPGVGITQDCTHPMHTHNDSGVIHIEHHHWDEFTLGDFFLVGQRWGEFDPLAGRQAVRVSVNGERYLDNYRTLPLADGLDIHLELVQLTSA